MNENQIKQHLGDKVRQFRKNLKLSQASLGEKIDINQRQIAQIECGKSFPSLKTLMKLSDVFSCEIETFFGTDENSISNKRKKFLKIINETSEKQLNLLFDIYGLLEKNL